MRASTSAPKPREPVAAAPISISPRSCAAGPTPVTVCQGAIDIPADSGGPSPSSRARSLALVALVGSAVATLVLLAFFLIGLADGSITSFNLSLWLLLLAIAGASLLGGNALRSRQRFLAATAALAVTAVPGLLAGLFLLLVLLLRPRWN